MKITVCVPAYNEEKYLLRCLESISMQENVEIDEILIGLNSSTDSSRELVEKYQNIDARIQIVDSLKGKANAWNALNSKARNNFRIFQDGDCVALKDSYKQLIDGLKENDIVGASLERSVKGENLLVKIINFPKRFVRPSIVLNGNLYLLNFLKVNKCMHRNNFG